MDQGAVRENGPAVIWPVVAVGAGVFGWRWWQAHLDAGRLEAGAKYTQMVQALDGGDRSRALVLFGELERGYAASPYTDQARLLAARLYVLGGELDRAAAELEPWWRGRKDRNLALGGAAAAGAGSLARRWRTAISFRRRRGRCTALRRGVARASAG